MTDSHTARPRSPARLALLPVLDLLAMAVLAAAMWRLLRVGDNGRAVDTFLDERRGTVYGAVVSIHSALLGFVLATATIVLGYAQSERFEMLRKSPHYRSLYRVFTASIGAFAVATLATLAALLVDRDDAPNRVAIALAIAASTVAIARLARALWVLRHVVDMVISTGVREPGE